MTSIYCSPELYKVISGWVKWVEDGTPEHGLYWRGFGLCYTMEKYGSPSVELEFDDIIKDHFGDNEFPFNGGLYEDYNQESEDLQMHLNPKRLAFAKRFKPEKVEKMTNTAIITNTNGCTIVIGTDVWSIAEDNPHYREILNAYDARDWDTVISLINVRDTLETFGQGFIRIEGDNLYYGDRQIHNGLTNRIIRLMREGQEGFAKTLMAFLDNMMENPSYRAVDGLYDWLERSNLPITPDGHFIAWKIVDSDFKDLRTRSFDNSPGQIVEVPRNVVDENPDVTCSSGLHFCSNEYLPKYGDIHGSSRIVMLKVNPRDVGAFPRDYNISKGRCCRYEVIAEVTPEETESLFENSSGVYKIVKSLKTSATDRALITLVFENGEEQKTTHRLGNTVTFDQKGDEIILRPSNRVIKIK